MTLSRPAARSLRAVLLGACAAFSLAACATVPDLGPMPQPKTFSPPAIDLPQSEWPAERWWAAYNDPQLAILIEEALLGSPDMATAAARIRKADAMAQQAGAARYPSLTASGQATRTRRSQNEGLPAGIIPNGWNAAGQGALQLSTELDLWGKTRASLAAATSEAEAVRADAANARLALSTAVAAAYADLAGLHADAFTAAQALRARTETEDLMIQRHAQGLETRAAVKRATANRAQAMSDVAAAAEGLAIGRNRLAALAGKGPQRAMQITTPTLEMRWRFGLPADIATDLVGRRPDVVAARLRTEAAAKRIKVAKADFYPSVRLSALIGVQALGIDRLTDATSTYGSMGPAISLPLFTGGALQGAYRGVRADYDMAVAAYDATLIRALNEVADAAVMAAALEPRAVRVREALDAAEDAYSLTLARYRGGLANYLDVLSAEDAVIAARRSLADLETRAFSVDIALVKALGGGFRDPKS